MKLNLNPKLKKFVAGGIVLSLFVGGVPTAYFKGIF